VMGSGYAPVLLATKIRPPRLPQGIIERPRLLALAEQVRAKTVTVVRAGAGFGKTSFAVTLANRIRACGGSVAWLSIDTTDDEPTRFLHSVACVLSRSRARGQSEAVDFLREMSLANGRVALAMLINDIADRDDEVFLFLDDYYLIAQPAIHDGMGFLLLNAPSNLHVVLTTRSDPPLPLARLRGRDQVLEIDTSDLRFDADEMRRFLEREKLNAPSREELLALTARMEGWPAMMRIAASAFARRPMRRALAASDAARHVETYLNEMLSGLPVALADFMVRTAVLERLTAPLCDVVLETANSREVLREIESRALLLVSVDRDATWFQFHPLLRDFLADRLNGLPAAEVAGLHRRAAQWFRASEDWTEAIAHAAAAGDEQQAASWIERSATVLLKRGDLLPLLAWQRLLPANLMRGQTKIRLAIAWGMALAMRFDDAMREVSSIEGETTTVHDLMDRETLICECEAIRAVALALSDDSVAAQSVAEAVLARGPKDASTFNAVSDVASFCYWKAGELARFHAVPWMPFSAEQSRRNVFVEVYRLCLRGLVLHEQLRIAAAERHYRDALRVAADHAGPDPAAAALPASLLAALRYDQGRADDAEALLLDRMLIVDAIGMLECVLHAYATLIAIAVRRGQRERAHTLADRAEVIGRDRRWARLISAVQLWRTRLYLADGRIADATECTAALDRLVAEHPAQQPCAWSAIGAYAAEAHASLAVASGRAREAIPVLARRRAEARAAEQRDSELRLAVHLALALDAAGAGEAAVDALADAIALAAPVSLHQPLLDAGPNLAPLLRRVRAAPASGVEVFAKQCLSALEPPVDIAPENTKGPLLSPREQSVLALLGEGRSNKDIARTLNIAPETVKSHVKNIFGKIGVERRAQAVSRAMSLGLITTA